MTGSSKAYDGRAIATLLILLMTFSTLPITNVSAEDSGDLFHLQAQDIQASFDSSTELTTITWRNIDSLDEPSALDNFYNSVYKVYRHTEVINQSNIQNATLIHEVITCDSEAYAVKYLCLGGDNGSHPGHSFSYLVAPGTNDSYYYGITTTITDQSNSEITYDSLISNESATYDPIVEITTPVRSPFNLQATFDPSSSITLLSWVNYNDIFFVLPETGPDAYVIRIYETNEPVTRQNSATLIAGGVPIAELSAGVSSHLIGVPVNTDRLVYYSITYLLPNHNGQGQDYEDIRFLSNNAMSSPVAEDNMPPSPISGVSGFFVSEPDSGDGTTTITWTDSAAEEFESYAVYSSGAFFNNTTTFGVDQLAIVNEGVGSFEYQVPVGRLGTSYYCVVIVDTNGIYDTEIPNYSCTSVFEDAFYDWVAEPTSVEAVFIGNSQTKITWVDQLGAEGESYNIWRSNYRVTGSQFVENVSVEYVASVTDGIQEYIVDIPPEQDRTSFYFVTSYALYQSSAGPYHYTELIQNVAGPVYEETITPAAPRINSAFVFGELSEITLEWLNDNQLSGEEYTIWKNYGNPFGVNENQVSLVSVDNGWIIHDSGIIDTGSTFTQFKFIETYQIPAEVESMVWYAITVKDSFGNENLEAFAGSGGNALKVKEDTINPTATFNVYDANGDAYTNPSLVSGSYTVRVLLNENLLTRPTVSITTSSGGQVTNGEAQMLLYADNLLNPDKGPEYYYAFDISNSISPGVLNFSIEAVDESSNTAFLFWNEKSLDAQRPQLSVYSPSSEDDGSKYLYGEVITIYAGASDDVRVDTLQYKFVSYTESGFSETLAWVEPDAVQDINGDGTALLFTHEISAGNFDPGRHSVVVRAIDSAGNEVSDEVIFIVDYCRNREDGTTVCNYEEELKDDPEPVIVEPSFSDPPYVFVWVSSGIAFISIILMLLVISAGMKGPKKNRSDDEYDDDDWMSEFIGTTQDVDMDLITNTTQPVPAEQSKDVPEIEEEGEDPFAVNVLQRKARRSKPKSEPEPEPEDDDDSFFGLDDDDFEDEEVEEKPKPKRKVGRRIAPRNAPKRRPTRRRKSED